MQKIEQLDSAQIRIIRSIDRVVAALDELPPLGDEDYALCLETFESSSDQRTALLNWLEENVIPEMSQRSSSILSVGCGTGVFDEQFLRSAKSTIDRIEYLGIDPNPVAAAQFLKAMKAHDSEWVDISILVEPFDEQVTERRFDLIFFVHSLYYLIDRDQAIDLAMKSLAPGGQLVICIAPKESLNAIANLTWQRQTGQSSWFSEDVENFFKTQRLEFRKTQIDAKLNFPGSLDLPNDTVERVVDFIVQANTDKFPPSLRQLIFEFLISISEADGSKVQLSHPVDIFTYKNPQTRNFP